MSYRNSFIVKAVITNIGIHFTSLSYRHLFLVKDSLISSYAGIDLKLLPCAATRGLSMTVF